MAKALNFYLEKLAVAEIALLERYVDEDMILLSSEIARREKAEAENASLKAQVKRLSAPLSPKERERLNASTNYAMGDTLERLFPLIDAIIAARAEKKP